MLVRDGVVRPLGSFSPMLGACEVEAWERTSSTLEPGDVLVLFTDGVFDTVGAGERFGEERLAQALAGVTGAAGAVAAIDVARLRDRRAGRRQRILAVQRMPVAAVARRG